MDINNIFSLHLAFSVFIAFVITILIYVSGRKSKSYSDYNNAIPVIEIVKTLEKICPVSCQNKWKLFPFDHGCHRCWSQSITLPFLDKNINLYSSATTVCSLPGSICSLIADVTRWSEWNPFFSSQYVAKPFHDKSLRRDHFMEAEQIISIVRESNKIQYHVIMYRFHDFSESKVGWILLWNPKKLEFLYFLIQPIKNRNDNPLCLLTHIMGTESKLYASSISLVSQRLRNIQDLLTFSSLHIVPSNFMPSVHPNTDDSKSVNKSHLPNNNNQDNYFSLASVRARKRDVQNTVFILVPFVQSVWSTNIEFKLAVKNMESAPSQKKPPSSQKSKENVPDMKAKSRPLRRTVSDVGVISGVLMNPEKIPSSNSEKTVCINNNSEPKNMVPKCQKQNSESTSDDSEPRNSKAPNKTMFSNLKLKSLSETAVNNLKNYKLASKSASSASDSNSVSKLENVDEYIEDKLFAISEQEKKDTFNSSISDFEILENSEFAENRIAGFMTQGNYGAAELQAEVLVASQFLLGMESGNNQSIGGWMFHSYHKNLCVLKKTTCSQFLKISSFMCQTEIPVAPKDVWKFVKCPQFRFICDESVKSVEILEKISSSQKLIHTYQEISGFIKKELMDFCLLQTEREEVNKYYSCFCSVEFDKCPFMNSVTRGILKPSGWIVEKVNNDPNRSKVTYMIQGLINSPDSLFIQELSTMVPQSVHNLKNYITSKPM